MDNKQIKIGNRIREVRKQKSLSQTELAKMLGKSLRTVQKYESGEIEVSIAMINELAKKLDTTPTYLIGYESNSIHIESLSDVCAFFFELEKKSGLKFDIDIKKPKTDGEWKCSISFDGQDGTADYNSQLCLFLEEYAIYREKLETYWISNESYEGWQNKQLAYLASSGIQDKEIENINEFDRLKKRNELMDKHRRRPYQVRITKGFRYDSEKDKQVQDFLTLGYVVTRAEGLQMLADYHKNPFDVSAAKTTFMEVYNKWSEQKYPTVSASNVNGYIASYKLCGTLYNKAFKDIRLADLQNVVDTCGKNYPTLRKLKVLFNQLFDYAMKNDICNKDYSEYVDIIKYKDKNPNKMDRDKFTKQDVNRFWELAEDKYYQIVLMLIYTGVRISELLDLKKANVNLKEQYFDVLLSKTENGIRKVPIADKVLPFFKSWYNSSDCEYLLHTEDGAKFKYRNYYDSYFVPLMDNLKLKQTPHCCRHTCISMLAEAKVDQTTIKKIVGHSGAMTLTEKVYTHLDVKELVNAINKI